MSLNTPLTINKVKTIEESYVVHSYEYRINDIQLHKSANIQIIFKDENGNIVMFRDRKIQGLEYKNWGEDDAYIDDIVKREITAMQSGIVENITPVRQPEPEPEPEPEPQPEPEPEPESKQ